MVTVTSASLAAGTPVTLQMHLIFDSDVVLGGAFNGGFARAWVNYIVSNGGTTLSSGSLVNDVKANYPGGDPHLEQTFTIDTTVGAQLDLSQDLYIIGQFNN